MNGQSYPAFEFHCSVDIHTRGQSTGFLGKPGDNISTG